MLFSLCWSLPSLDIPFSLPSSTLLSSYIFIIITIGFCIWQWYRKVRELKNLFVGEQKKRVTADQYIYARLSPAKKKEEMIFS